MRIQYCIYFEIKRKITFDKIARYHYCSQQFIHSLASRRIPAVSSEKSRPGNTPCTSGRIIVRLSRDSFFFRLPIRPHVKTGPRAVCTDAVASPRRGAKGALSPRPGLQDEKARAHADSSWPPSPFKQQYRVLYIILLLLFVFQLCTTYTACNLLKGTHTRTYFPNVSLSTYCK